MPCHTKSNSSEVERDTVSRWEEMLFACLGGLDYATYSHGGLHQEKESSFYEKTSVIWDCAENAAQAHFKQQRALVAEREKKETLIQLDGAWSTRGFTAHDHTFILRDAKFNKVLFVAVVQKKKTGTRKGKDTVLVAGNHDGSSQTMEATGLKMFLDEVDPEFLKKVAIIVTDGDVKLPGELEQILQKYGIVHAKDPGHVVKAFIKRLRVFLGDKFDSIYRRIKSSVMRLIKRCEYEITHSDLVTAHQMRVDAFQVGLRMLYKHYTERPCPSDCICHGKLSLLSLLDLTKYCSESSTSPDDSPIHAHSIRSPPPIADADDGDESDEDEVLGSSTIDNRENSDFPSISARQPSANKSTLRKFHNMHRATSQPWQPSMTHQTAINTNTTAATKSYLVYIEKSPGTEASKTRRVAFDKMMASIKEEFDQLETTISPALWGANTCAVEGSHSRRLKFVDKDKSYFKSFAGRTTLSAYLENVLIKEAAGAIWEELQSSPNMSFLPPNMSDTLQSRLDSLDKKRTADSNRKKSLEYKLQEKRRERLNVERRKSEKTSSKGLSAHRSDPLTSPDAPSSKKRARAPNTTKNTTTNQRPSKRPAPILLPDDDTSASFSEDSPLDDKMISESDDPDDDGLQDILDMESEKFDSASVAMSVDLASDTEEGDLAMLLTPDEMIVLAVDLSLTAYELEKETQQLRDLVEADGYNLVDLPNSRDGNCYFRVLAANCEKWSFEEIEQTFNIRGRITHAKLRTELIQWMREHPDTIHTVDRDAGIWYVTLKDATKNVGWEKWLEKMALNGTYGEDLLITAASNAFNLRQVVYFEGEPDIIEPNAGSQETTKTVHLALGINQRHYFAVF